MCLQNNEIFSMNGVELTMKLCIIIHPGLIFPLENGQINCIEGIISIYRFPDKASLAGSNYAMVGVSHPHARLNFRLILQRNKNT